MKTFTAKQFSRTPKVIFDAAKEDGKVEITHGWLGGQFILTFAACKDFSPVVEYKIGDHILHNGQLCVISAVRNGVIVSESENGSVRPFDEIERAAKLMDDNSMGCFKDNGDGTISLKRPLEWSLNDPIPNVYVDEKIDCKRHPEPNNVVGAKNLGKEKGPEGPKSDMPKDFKAWDENVVYKVGDMFVKDGVKCVISHVTCTYDVYKKPSEEG